MQVHLVSPTGERRRPFSTWQAARDYGVQAWPGKQAGCRETEPDAWEIEIERSPRPNSAI